MTGRLIGFIASIAAACTMVIFGHPGFATAFIVMAVWVACG